VFRIDANGGAPVSTGASFVLCGVHEARRTRKLVGNVIANDNAYALAA